MDFGSFLRGGGRWARAVLQCRLRAKAMSQSAEQAVREAAAERRKAMSERLATGGGDAAGCRLLRSSPPPPLVFLSDSQSGRVVSEPAKVDEIATREWT
eukprot:11581808-Alexandrium_andersonii.AAC.1